MPTIKLTWKKLKAIHFGLIPIIMFIVMTARTLTAGDGVMLTGLCVALLPFFATARSASCVDETNTEVQDIFSNYLLYLIFVTVGMLYLKGLTLVAAEYVPGYVPS
ncbi:MAG: hypothetical protein IJF50_01590, partial [Peptococcaceae bacterium]|nr:hypothetical protein [Peptococcaceae bacterium]